MKKILMFVAIVVFMYSCEKIEVVEPVNPVDIIAKSINDTEVNRAKVAAFPLMSENEVRSRLSLNKTKFASTTNGNDVSVFPLNSQEIIFFGDSVRRFSVYIEKNEDGYREKQYTLSQTYFVNNGVIDANSYWFDFEYGCPQARVMRLTKVSNVYNLKLFFFANDGKNFYYNLNSNNEEIYVSPFANGYWVVQGTTDDGDLPQLFVSAPINPYSSSNLISMEIQIQEMNVKYYVEMHCSVLKDVEYVLLFGEDNDGNTIVRYHPVLKGSSMIDFISYGTSFNIKAIQLCGKNGCQWHSTDNMKLTIDLKGIFTYHFQ